MTDREEAAALSEADRALCEALDGYGIEEETLDRAAQRIRELSRQLHAAEADADRLAEVLGETISPLEWDGQYILAGEAREALAAHTAHKIDG